MRVVAFIPAKGTSERVPNKNTKVLGRKPLFLHIVDTLLACCSIDEVYLDTETYEVAAHLDVRNKCRVLKRPEELATNATDGNKLLLWEAEQVEADIYVQALPTAPFLLSRTVDKAIELVKNKWPSVIAATFRNHYHWDRWADGTGGRARYDARNIPNAKNLPPTVRETMGLYVIRREELINTGLRTGHHPYLLGVSDIEAIDIDTEEDFRFAEIIWKGSR